MPTSRALLFFFLNHEILVGFYLKILVPYFYTIPLVTPPFLHLHVLLKNHYYMVFTYLFICMLYIYVYSFLGDPKGIFFHSFLLEL